MPRRSYPMPRRPMSARALRRAAAPTLRQKAQVVAALKEKASQRIRQGLAERLAEGGDPVE